MSIQYPVALLLMFLILPLVWLHRRGEGRKHRPFSLFFLLADDDQGASGGQQKIKNWPLFCVRVLILAVLTAFIAGIQLERPAGTIVLLDGPARLDSGWRDPVTFVRAGEKPEEVDSSMAVRTVISPPNWTAAAMFGRRLNPRARIIVGEGERAASDGPVVGARLSGAEVVVSAYTSSSGEVTLHQRGQTYPMSRRKGHWFFRGVLKPGIAQIKGADIGEDGWLCIPDASPLKVARTGWPLPVLEVLKSLNHIDFVSAKDADWAVGATTVGVEGWPFAAPRVTRFSFADDLNRVDGATHFRGPYQIRGWSPIAGGHLTPAGIRSCSLETRWSRIAWILLTRDFGGLGSNRMTPGCRRVPRGRFSSMMHWKKIVRDAPSVKK